MKPEASSKEIKSKYFKLAKKYHPDTLADAQSESSTETPDTQKQIDDRVEKFKVISAAYEILGDESNK